MGIYALIRLSTPGNNKMYITVVDTQTGAVVDTPIEMNGEFIDFNNGKLQVVENRVYVQTIDYDANTSELAIIDTTTGMIGDPVTNLLSRHLPKVTRVRRQAAAANLVFITHDYDTSETIVTVLRSRNRCFIGAEPAIISGLPSTLPSTRPTTAFTYRSRMTNPHNRRFTSSALIRRRVRNSRGDGRSHLGRGRSQRRQGVLRICYQQPGGSTTTG